MSDQEKKTVAMKDFDPINLTMKKLTSVVINF